MIFDGALFELCVCGKDAGAEWIVFSEATMETLIKYGIKTNSIYCPRNSDFISPLIGKIKRELAEQKAYYPDICNFYFNELLIGLSRETNDESIKKTPPSKTDEILHFLRRKLSAEYYRNWSVNSMAELINLSPSYLHTAYKTLFGTSPVKDLISFRLIHAKELLVKTNLSVNEIANQVGYSNTSHFIRQFTDKEGVSPHRYRKTVLNGNVK